MSEQNQENEVRFEKIKDGEIKVFLKNRCLGEAFMDPTTLKWVANFPIDTDFPNHSKKYKNCTELKKAIIENAWRIQRNMS